MSDEATRKLIEERALKALETGVPTTQRLHLEQFCKASSDREWHQLLTYAHVMSLVRDVPGDILEFGVASGSSFMTLTRINEIYNKAHYHPAAHKKIYGFDSFDGLPAPDPEKDLAKTGGQPYASMREGGFKSTTTLPELVRFVHGRPNCFLVKGMFDESLPRFLKTRPHLACALIHIDCDIYASTRTVLDALIDRVPVGGILLFDEIFHEEFPGETAAYFEVAKAHSATFRFERSAQMPWLWYAVRER